MVTADAVFTGTFSAGDLIFFGVEADGPNPSAARLRFTRTIIGHM